MIDHPNRPSVAMHAYSGDLFAQALAAERAGNPHSAELLRTVARRISEMATTAECHYESKVSDLMCAALDELDGGGFAGEPEDAMAELVRCVNNLRTGRPLDRGAAA